MGELAPGPITALSCFLQSPAHFGLVQGDLLVQPIVHDGLVLIGLLLFGIHAIISVYNGVGIAGQVGIGKQTSCLDRDPLKAFLLICTAAYTVVVQLMVIRQHAFH